MLKKKKASPKRTG